MALIAAGLLPGSAAVGYSSEEREATLEERVQQAVTAGVERLRKGQSEDGSFRMGFETMASDDKSVAANRQLDRSWLATTSLAVATLRSCGAGAEDPAIRSAVERAWAWWSDSTTRTRRLRLDSASMTLRAIESLRDETGRFPVYGTAAAPLGEREFMKWATALRDWILEHERRGDGGRAVMSAAGVEHRHSRTYGAMLGLCAARELGLEVPSVAWRDTMQHMLKAQQREGPDPTRGDSDAPDLGDRGAGTPAESVTGSEARARGWALGDSPAKFDSKAGDPATGYMTAAGVLIVSACRDALLHDADYSPEEDLAAEKSIRDGLTWLGLFFQRDLNPGARSRSVVLADGEPSSPEQLEDVLEQMELAVGGKFSRSHQYYEYIRALALVGVATGARKVGKHDWYQECASWLVDAQRHDGSWDGSDTSTCLVLMFLRRDGIRMPGAAVARSPYRDLDVSGADALADVQLAEAFEEVFRDAWRSKSPAGESSACAALVLLGPRVVPLLIRALESPSASRRTTASALLSRLSPEAPVASTASGAADSVEGVAAWEAWWMRHRKALTRDVAGARFATR